MCIFGACSSALASVQDYHVKRFANLTVSNPQSGKNVSKNRDNKRHPKHMLMMKSITQNDSGIKSVITVVQQRLCTLYNNYIHVYIPGASTSLVDDIHREKGRV